MGKELWRLVLLALCVVVGIAAFPWGILLVVVGAALLASIESTTAKAARQERQETERRETLHRRAEEARMRRDRHRTTDSQFGDG